MNVIIGLGPNQLEIPLVICESVESAQALLKRLELEPTKDNPCRYKVNLEPADDLVDEDARIASSQWREALITALFKGEYWGGCGDCDMLEIRPVTFNSPIVGWGWNLD